MDKDEVRWHINETLKNRGFHHVGPESDRYEGSINVGHTAVNLELLIPDIEFGKIPIVKILNRPDIPIEIIAHIEQGTGLCYGTQDFLRLDKYRPGESILRVLKEAEETIAKSLSGKWNSEIISEFPLYWSSCEIQIPYEIRTLPPNCYLIEHPPTISGLTKLSLSIEKTENVRSFKEVHVIQLTGNLNVNDNIITPNNLQELEKWSGQETIRNSTSFDKIIKQFCANKIVLFIADNGAVGCSIKLLSEWKNIHPKNPARRHKTIRKLLLTKKSKHRLDHFRGTNTSLAFVCRRNSLEQSSTLTRKNIALIGCGTIGSHLARYLVQSGAGYGADLILVDNQRLTAGNLGRHLCNYADIGEHKAIALSNELNRFHPDLQIRPLCCDITDMWESVKDADLIIDAAGIEDIGDFLNSKALDERANGKQSSILHVWLNGNGIGAQSFLNAGGKKACYRCLRPNVEQPARFDMRKDVAQESTVVSPSCGEGAYVPYLVDAPIQAACIALNATHDFFRETYHPTLRSLLFDKIYGKKIKDQTPKRSNHCPACNT